MSRQWLSDPHFLLLTKRAESQFSPVTFLPRSTRYISLLFDTVDKVAAVRGLVLDHEQITGNVMDDMLSKGCTREKSPQLGRHGRRHELTSKCSCTCHSSSRVI